MPVEVFGRDSRGLLFDFLPIVEGVELGIPRRRRDMTWGRESTDGWMSWMSEVSQAGFVRRLGRRAPDLIEIGGMMWVNGRQD
jgi:hypothetical protein